MTQTKKKTKPSEKTLAWLKAARESVEHRKKVHKGNLAEIFPD